MSIFPKILTLLSLFFFCMNLAHTNEITDCNEHIEFYLNLNKWKQAFKNSNEFAAIVEFTLQEENVNNWTELVTVQQLPPIEGTMDQYHHIFMDNLKKTISPSQAYSHIIKKSKNTLLFEWWIPHGIFAQHEWFKLIKSPCSIWILRYTTKKMDQVEKERDTWKNIR